MPGSVFKRWRRRHHGRLFHRVYRHGLLLVFFVGLTIFGVGALLRPDRPWQDLHEHLVQYMAAHYADLRDHPDLLARQVDRARELLEIELTIYGPDGRVEASNVVPPLPMPRPGLRAGRRAADGRGPWSLDREDDAPRHWHERRRLRIVMPLADGAVAVARGPRWPSAPVPVQLVVVLACLAVVALVSYPLARGLVKPIERLTDAARAFGRGDLAARSGLPPQGEVGALAAAFDEMAERIARQMAAEKALLASVSHELRTPLARIRIAVELAEVGGETGARHLRAIGTDIDELDRLLSDLMTTVRLDAASLEAAPPLNRERIAARVVLDRAVERFRDLFPERVLTVAFDDALPVLDADPVLLRRVVDNLLDNARKYSDGVITLDARARAALLVVSVTDTGPGIDPADVPHLFTPFFRADRSRTRGTGGVGLGLALARRIVEAHGGSIAVHTRPGTGTTFEFKLPAAQSPSM
jgi:two-component system OmpR family sensor kinase